jgi:hypothetical protein
MIWISSFGVKFRVDISEVDNALRVRLFETGNSLRSGRKAEGEEITFI